MIQRSSYAALAVGIVIFGAAGAILPGLMDAGNPVSYLRDAGHGRHGTTTSMSPLVGRLTHRWGNEEMPVADGPSQMPMVVPPSGGAPNAEPEVR